MNVTKTTPKRLKCAYLIAPILPVLVSLLVVQPGNISYSFLVLIFSIPISYLSCLLIGLPLVLFLKKNEWLSIINTSIGGAILGSIVFYLFGIVLSYFLDSTPLIMLPNFPQLLSGAILGLFVALPFSIIAGFPFKV